MAATRTNVPAERDPATSTNGAGPELPTYTVDLAAIRPGTLSVGQLIAVSDATGLDVTDLQRILVSGRGTDQLRVMAGFAWLQARQADPDLTYQDVLGGQLRVTGQRDRPRPARTRGAGA